MRVKKPPAIILCLFLCLQQSYLYAQEKSKVQFGKVVPADFILPSTPIIDSNAGAVILYDVGNIQFEGNEHDWFSYVFKVKERIKIIHKDAIKRATVRIRLYKAIEGGEKLIGVTGSSYNLENGRVVEARLSKEDVYKEEVDKDWTEMKFTLPSVKEGSVIEYSYTIVSRYTRSLPGWNFQSEDYPNLWSELEVEIPQTITYAIFRQGIHNFAIDQGSEGAQTYKVVARHFVVTAGTAEQTNFVTANTIKHHWLMKDLPAFHVENYISAPRNYVDKLSFQESGTYNGEQQDDVTNNWKNATDEWLGYTYYFGTIRDDNDWLNATVAEATESAAGQLAQARAIYYYVSSHFTCTDYDNPFLRNMSLREVFQKGSGSVGGVNMLMLAMLRKLHIAADPVLLSTRDHGKILTRYPVQEKFNYNIVRIVVGGKMYFLDAAHPKLGFGELAGNCYNGPARIINTQDSGFVYFNPSSLKESKTTMVLITNGEKGGLDGSYQSTLGAQESFEAREEIGRIGQKKYFSNIQTANGSDLQISNTGFDSLGKSETPLNIHYDFNIKQSADGSVYYFTPLLSDTYKRNPFEASERKYPVEMPYSLDDSYILNMEIPAGYGVEEIPTSAKVALNDNQGNFEYLVSADSKNIQLRVRLTLNRTEFPPGDYGNLRDFFGYIVKKESEQIVLKKIANHPN